MPPTTPKKKNAKASRVPHDGIWITTRVGGAPDPSCHGSLERADCTENNTTPSQEVTQEENDKCGVFVCDCPLRGTAQVFLHHARHADPLSYTCLFPFEPPCGTGKNSRIIF